MVGCDDGDALPPLASPSARIWARGRSACGASAEEVKARAVGEARARGEDPDAVAVLGHARGVNPASKPPRPPRSRRRHARAIQGRGRRGYARA